MKTQTLYISDDGFVFETKEEHDKYIKLLLNRKLVCRKKDEEENNICVYWLKEKESKKEIGILSILARDL